jgi:hypothetical protein
MVSIRVYHVPKPFRVFATEGENATMETLVPESAIVILVGMVMHVPYVDLPFKAKIAMNANVDGRVPAVTNVTRVIVDQTVMCVRKVGYRRQIV